MGKNVSLDYEVFFDLHPSPSWICHADTSQMLDVNQAALQFFGYTKERFLKIKIEALLVDPGAIRENLCFYSQIAFQGSHGDVMYAPLTIRPYDRGGECCHIYSFSWDGLRRRESSTRSTGFPNEYLAQFRDGVQDNSIVSITDRKGVITYVNENFTQICGYSALELLGTTHSIVNSGYHDAAFWGEMWKEVSQGNSWRKDVKNVGKDGTYYWVDTFIMPFKDELGNIQGYFSLRNDITAKKQAEELLQHSTEQLKEALYFSRTGTILLHIDEDNVTLSPEFLSMMNEKSPTSKIMGFDEMVKAYVVPSEQLSFKNAFTKSIKECDEEHEINLEANVYTKDFTQKAVAIKARINGPEIFAFVQDITEEISGNEELKRLALIAEHTRNLVLFTDEKGRITWVNKGFERVTEYTFKEVMGKKPGEFLQGPDTNQESIRFMRQNLSRKEGFRLEILNYSKSHRPYWVDIEVIPFKHSNGEIKGFMAIQSDITRLKIAVEEMLKSQEQLQTIMDNSPVEVFVKDRRGRYLFYNKSFEQHFIGDHLESPITTDKLFDVESVQKFLTNDRMVFETGQSITIEDELSIKGDLYNFLTVKFPMKNMKGEIYAIGGVALNITRRKQMETALRDSEERLRNISDNLPTGAIYQQISKKGESEFSFSYLSTGIESISGLKAYKVLINSDLFLERIHPDDLPKFLEASYTSKSNVALFDCEFRLKALDGSTKWIRARSSPRQLPSGDVVWDGFMMDFTDRKRIEEKLLQSESRLQNIFNSLISGVVVVNTIGEINYANESAVQILELSNDQLNKRFYSSREFRQIDESGNDFPIEDLPLSIALHQEKSVSSVQHGIISPKGEVKWLLVSASPLYNEDNELIGAVASFLDITEQEKAAKAVKKSENETRAILNSSSDSILLLDRYYTVLVVNTMAAIVSKNLFNHAFQVGDNMLEYIPTKELDVFKTYFERALIGEKIEYDLENTDIVQFRWLSIRLQPVYNIEGQLFGVSLNARDTTERKLAEERLYRSQKLFESLVNSQTNLLIRTNSRGIFTFTNRMFCEKIDWGGTDVVGHSFLRFISDTEFKRYLNVIDQCVKEPGRVVSTVLKLSSKKGECFWTEWEFIAIQSDDRLFIEVQGVGHDVTEEIRAKESIERQYSLLSLINSAQLHFIQDTNAEYVFKDLLENIMLLTRSEYGFLGEVVSHGDRTSLKVLAKTNALFIANAENGNDIIAFDDPYHTLSTYVQEILERKAPSIFNSIVLGESSSSLDNFMGIPLFRGDQMVGMLGLASQRTEFYDDLIQELSPVTTTLSNIIEALQSERVKRQTSLKLKETTARLSLATSSAGIGVWELDIETGKAVWEDECYTIFGLPEGSAPNHKAWESMLHPDDRVLILDRFKRAIFEHVEYDVEYRIARTSDGEIRYIKDCGIVQYNEKGEPLKMVGVIWDITEQRKYQETLKRSESKLKDSLAEKELLIKEIHHRVKNNLQLISSIIYFKSSSLAESEFKSYLENMRQRIKSIALIHERLLQTEHINQVEISDYLGKLLRDIEVSHCTGVRKVKIRCAIQLAHLPLDTAIYCGLIVNEVVTNSLKHAFQGRSQGVINVSFLKENNKFRLEIEDDGVSMPVDFLNEKTDSFGMQMLDVFIKQIGGKLTIKRGKGTKYKMEFQYEHKERKEVRI